MIKQGILNADLPPKRETVTATLAGAPPGLRS